MRPLDGTIDQSELSIPKSPVSNEIVSERFGSVAYTAHLPGCIPSSDK